jgi:hypothetical protein
MPRRASPAGIPNFGRPMPITMRMRWSELTVRVWCLSIFSHSRTGYRLPMDTPLIGVGVILATH